MIDNFERVIQADIHILYQSESYRITDYKCSCINCSLSEPEYNDSFCISFIRSGFFEYQVFRHQYDAHVGRILLSKPGYEHRARHIDNQPDVVTVFEFSKSFFETLKEQCHSAAGWFLENNDIHALLVSSTADTDYLHDLILRLLQSNRANALQVDELVVGLLDKIFKLINTESEMPSFSDKFKQLHLGTIERAIDYMQKHFSENISLEQLSGYCFVSPFHFSRIFKNILRTSPHKYLLQIRLAHAKILLTSTSRPVVDIAFDCGFNSLEHFATAYRQRFRMSPSEQRVQFAV
jgi:AraC family transcriptional regulator